MSRTVQVVLLCEDRQHEVFARRFLERAGRHLRVQRVEISPKGRGAGEQFVRERFAKELAHYRARKHRVEQALIVLIDADGRDVATRIEQIESACVEVGERRRQAEERVAIFVPARNIETWLAYLEGQTVNENDVYPRLKRERDCQRHVDSLYGMCRQETLRHPSPPLARCSVCGVSLEAVIVTDRASMKLRELGLESTPGRQRTSQKGASPPLSTSVRVAGVDDGGGKWLY